MHIIILAAKTFYLKQMFRHAVGFFLFDWDNMWKNSEMLNCYQYDRAETAVQQGQQ